MVKNETSSGTLQASESGSPILVASMVEDIIGCKWSVQLLRSCAEGHKRPSSFLRECPGLSSKVMNERLRKMIRFGILRRTVLGDKPPVEVEYRLTTFGLRFMKVIDEVRLLQEALDHGDVSDDVSVNLGEQKSGHQK